MDDTPANLGLWVVLPPPIYEAAVKHGYLRQSHAIRRRAQPKWGPADDPVLAENHVDQSKFERGCALALGLRDPERINTDHDFARLDLPDGSGLWPRACPKLHIAPYINGQTKDFDYLVGGRVHDHEEVRGEIRCVVEVRTWIAMETVRKTFHPVDPGQHGKPFFQIYWSFKPVEPIRTLADRYHLDTSACLPGPPPGISDRMPYAPERDEPVQCEDGCPDRRPSGAGGFVCNVCGFYLFR